MIKREGLRPLNILFLILGEIPWDIKMTEQEQAAHYQKKKKGNLITGIWLKLKIRREWILLETIISKLENPHN